jgi:hypothetical protein
VIKFLYPTAFNFSGKIDWSIDLLIKTLMGFVITGCANLMILGEIPSYPVAFLMFKTALLRIIEDWKKALDDNKFIAAILMDLSKAFDCLPHNLLMLKLEAYGLSENSLKLLKH